jgi:hypothetical protein
MAVPQLASADGAADRLLIDRRAHAETSLAKRVADGNGMEQARLLAGGVADHA